MKGKPLNEAYADALKEKAAKESDESNRERLRRETPDLADQVTSETSLRKLAKGIPVALSTDAI
jgi:hypothetical protein